jgi:hypothetical protein
LLLAVFGSGGEPVQTRPTHNGACPIVMPFMIV